MNHLTRRAFLGNSAAGLGALALASLLKPEVFAAGGILGQTHFAPKARRVIFLFMAGGPSHVDLFDRKPKLNELEGQPIPPELLKNHQHPESQGFTLQVPATWTLRHGHFGTAPAPCKSRRRTHGNPLDAHRHERA